MRQTRSRTKLEIAAKVAEAWDRLPDAAHEAICHDLSLQDLKSVLAVLGLSPLRASWVVRPAGRAAAGARHTWSAGYR